MSTYETVFRHKDFEVLRRGEKYFLKVKGDLRKAIRKYASRELKRGKRKLEEMKQWSQKHREPEDGLENRMDSVRPQHFDLERTDGKAGSFPSSTSGRQGPADNAQLNKLPQKRGRRRK